MTNNDILRRLRFTFNYTDKQICDLFALADVGVTTEQVFNWLRKDDDKDQVNLPDQKLAAFLNGWIVKNRGKKDGQLPINEKELTNNLILNKIKIALSLKAEDILSLLNKVDFNLGKAELSAFFRKPDHKHYRQCKDQIVRNLLTALQKHHRPIKALPTDDSTASSVKSKSKSQVKKQPNQGARPNKSKVYVNPNAKAKSAKKTSNTLKLKPEQIWGTTDK